MLYNTGRGGYALFQQRGIPNVVSTQFKNSESCFIINNADTKGLQKCTYSTANSSIYYMYNLLFSLPVSPYPIFFFNYTPLRAVIQIRPVSAEEASSRPQCSPFDP